MTDTQQDLRQRADQALQEAELLAVRMGGIDAEIEAERENIKARRIMAARRGESPMQATDRSTLEELQAERDELPELHFAARLNAAAAQIAAEEATVEQLEAEVEGAREELRPLSKAAREAQAREATAHQNLVQAEGALVAAKERRRRSEGLMNLIETEGPRSLD